MPQPPLPGTNTILPLTTVEELLLEGQVRHSCVAAYAPDVIGEGCCIYRVIHPRRCALSVKRSENGSLVIDQIAERGNSPAMDETIGAVEKWLDEEEHMERRNPVKAHKYTDEELEADVRCGCMVPENRKSDDCVYVSDSRREYREDGVLEYEMKQLFFAPRKYDAIRIMKERFEGGALDEGTAEAEGECDA